MLEHNLPRPNYSTAFRSDFFLSKRFLIVLSLEGAKFCKSMCFSIHPSGVRKRGNSVNRSSKDWQMPEIRHNMGERLTLFDPIARCSREVDLAREERAKLWQSAHCEGVRV